MSVYFLWGGIGVFALFLIIGLCAGLVRGLKRSSLHILFLIASVVLAFFITKPVTNAILGATITVEGVDCTISEWLIKLIQTNFDLSNFGSATAFLERLPNAIASPIVFLLLTIICYFVFDIIYMIVARISFGSKKSDFKENKPNRAYGGVIGILEGFMFLFIMFAPLTALTKTYQEIVELPPAQTQSLVETTQPSQKLKPIGEMLSGILPPQVNEAIFAYNNCVIGKIAGAGGLDNAIFDGLSNFDFEGQKIELRKELINLTDVYDEFTVVYNNIIDNVVQTIDLTSLKENIEIFLNNGMFKTVISNTINDFVVKFEEIKTSMNLQNLPPIVKDIVKEIQARFAETDFDTYEYLKHDILKVLDVAQEVVSSDLINKYQNTTDKSFVGILEFVDANNIPVSNIAKQTLTLNLVKDSFTTLGNFASQKIEGFLQNDKGLEIALNTNIADKNKMVEDLLGAVDEFLSLNNVVNIPELLNSTDILASISKIENLDVTFTKLGATFDKLKNLEILILPVTETRLETVYVFDNILKLYDLDVLKDEVYLTNDATTKTKLDTYTKFFNFVKEPIIKAKNLQLMELGKEGTTFETVLDNVLIELKTNENLLSSIMLPFYQLSALNLKTLVFDKIVNELSNNVSLLDFTEIKNIDTFKVWNDELNLLGVTLNSLNQGQINVAGQDKTYLKYLMSTGADLQTLLKDIVNNNKLADILDPVFTSSLFTNLTTDIFNNIDTSIESLTGVKPVTNLDNLSTTKAETISTIETLLNLTLNVDMNNLGLTDIGKILDSLKTNAYNNSNKNGVFNEIFTNIIWYLTGDDISGTNKFDGKTPNSNASDIKAYLNVASTENFVGYYTLVSYENVMKELADVIDFANVLNSNISGITLTDTASVQTFVTGIKTALNSLEGKTENEKVVILENMRKLIDRNGSEILSTQDKTNYGDAIIVAIDNEFVDSPIGLALKNLLGLSV